MEPAIRMATPQDAAALAEIYAPNVEVKATSFELVPPDAPQMAERVAAVLARWPWLVIERDGDLLGYAYASAYAERAAYQWSVTVSAYVREGCHRRGLGRRLYTTLFEILRRQGACSAFAGITLPNPASVGLHTAMGFEPVGVYPRVGFKLDRWHDVIWLRRVLRPLDDGTPPPSLRPLAELLVRGELDDLLAPRPG